MSGQGAQAAHDAAGVGYADVAGHFGASGHTVSVQAGQAGQAAAAGQAGQPSVPVDAFDDSGGPTMTSALKDAQKSRAALVGVEAEKADMATRQVPKPATKDARLDSPPRAGAGSGGVDIVRCDEAAAGGGPLARGCKVQVLKLGQRRVLFEGQGQCRLAGLTARV